MGTFFALGAIGGMLSLTMQGKPILTSPHVWSGFGGLALLGLNGMLALFFEDDPNARSLVSGDTCLTKTPYPCVEPGHHVTAVNQPNDASLTVIAPPSQHAYLGSATMAVFVLHLVFGLQLGLSI